jgi:hypothetical protein
MPLTVVVYKPVERARQAFPGNPLHIPEEVPAYIPHEARKMPFTGPRASIIDPSTVTGKQP